MEFSKKDMKILQGVAILFMLALHLFARKDINGLYETFPMINGVPLVYYLALFGDACVPIYLFASGYGLYITLGKESGSVMKKNLLRILKLLINFWLILFTFMGVALFIGKFSEAFLGGLSAFFLNFTLLSNSFNGAWWYIQTYVILVLLTPSLIKIVKRYPSILLLIFSGLIYLISYIQRIKHVIDLGDNQPLIILVNAVVLLGTSQLSFIVGFIFAKEKLYSKLYDQFHSIHYKNIICTLLILVLVVIHSFYESMIIAPITAICFICLFNLMDKGRWLQRPLLFIGKNSTNIWLIHMFFYLSLFPDLIFATKYPLLIFLNLLFFSLISSVFINIIYNPILKFIDKKQHLKEREYSSNVTKPIEV